MIISRDQTIAGRPAVEIRDVMRSIRGRGYTVIGLAESQGVGESDGRDLVADLVAEGYLERAHHPTPVVVGSVENAVPFDELVVFTTTIAGNALAKAPIGKRMPRAEADRLLQGVINRAAEVNDSDGWLHWVPEIVLYGSLASAATARWATSTWAWCLSRGGVIFGPSVAQRVLATVGGKPDDNRPFPHLTDREHDVLRLLVT